MKCQNCKSYEVETDEEGICYEYCFKFSCYLNEIAGLDPFEGCEEYVSALAIIGEK